MSKTENAPEKKRGDRALRGGCWIFVPQGSPRRRADFPPGIRDDYNGVRLVEVIDEQDENLPEKKGSDRVNRGGSCGSGPRHARAAHYFLDTPDNRSWNLGVRLVEMLDEQD